MKLVSIDDATAKERKESADIFRETADRIESGAITEFVVVANDTEEGVFVSKGVFKDRWRILGALEYAKQTIHEN